MSEYDLCCAMLGQQIHANYGSGATAAALQQQALSSGARMAALQQQAKATAGWCCERCGEGGRWYLHPQSNAMPDSERLILAEVEHALEGCNGRLTFVSVKP